MPSNSTSAEEWCFWLRLMLTPGVGNEGARKLLRCFGDPQQIFKQSQESLQTCVAPRIASALLTAQSALYDEILIKTERWLQSDSAYLVYLGHPLYPSQLLEIPDPPTLLYIKGDINYLKHSSLAIVGSRNATAQGIEHASTFAQALSQGGWCISSGLAAGIDAAAHAGGLNGKGGTIAVIGTGIDIVYPARHRTLAHEIAEHGCIVSEYHLGTGPLQANFPRRNRIISGLAKGVLVVEAAEKSGSLITARMAAEQGRDVFAIPGSIHSPLAKGCHQLIKQGAKLVESAEDINEEYPGLFEVRASQESVAVATEKASLLNFIGYDPVQFDVLVERTKLTASTLSTQIFELELEGHIELLAGGSLRRLR